MRLFVAIVLPPAVAAELARWLEPVQAAAGPGLRWTSPDSWHITLAFLGEVADPVIPELRTRLAAVASGHPGVQFLEHDRTQPQRFAASNPSQTQGYIVSRPQSGNVDR